MTDPKKVLTEIANKLGCSADKEAILIAIDELKQDRDKEAAESERQRRRLTLLDPDGKTIVATIKRETAHELASNWPGTSATHGRLCELGDKYMDETGPRNGKN